MGGYVARGVVRGKWLWLACARSAALPEMRKMRWGRLLFVSSTAARLGGIVGPHYAASKAGLEGLMRSYASLVC
jgi:NAD(P)-dependent dehydrogenase (short-subunit alcohol dehydrogenase family)